MKKKQQVRANKRSRKLQANSNNNSGRGGRSSFYGWDLTPGYHNSNTNLDYWDAAGYPKQLSFSDHWKMQGRFGIAKSGIHKIVDRCWSTPPMITDGENDGERPLTPFEKDLDILINKHHLFSRLKGADWRQRVGRYGAILPIIREQNPNKTNEPITKVNGIAALIKLVPKMESEVTTDNSSTVSDIYSEQYGMPTHYNLREDVNGDRNPIDNNQVILHPSRLFIFAEGADDGSIYGIPANEGCFNALMDLEIICASGQTALRKNAKQRFVSNINDNQVAIALKDTNLKSQYDSNVDNFNRGDSPNLTVYGMDITPLQSQIADPTSAFNNSLNVCAASWDIPASEIIGVQMNKQATTTNETSLNDKAKSRRENYINPTTIDFLNYFIEIGVLRAPTNEILIEWDDLNEDSPSEKLDLGGKMTTMNKQAFDSGSSEGIFTSEEIRTVSGLEAEPEEELDQFGEDDDELTDEVTVADA